jgi:thiol-disulfide isomerase/thioredoxin
MRNLFALHDSSFGIDMKMIINPIKSKRNLFFILVIASFATCSKKEVSEYANLQFKLGDAQIDTLKIYQKLPLSLENVNEKMVVLDSIGGGTIKINLPQSGFVTIELGNINYGNLLLKNGYDIDVYFNPEDIFGTIKFEGAGSEINNTIVDVYKTYLDNQQIDGTYFFNLDSTDFISWAANLKSVSDEKITKLKSEKSISFQEKKFLTHFNEIMLKTYILNYHLSHPSKNASGPITIPFDTTLLNAKSVNYYLALSLFFDQELSNPCWENHQIESRDSIKQDFQLKLYNTIQRAGIPVEFKEYFTAHHVYNNYLLSDYHSSTLENLFLKFSEDFPESKYKNTIKEMHDKMFDLSKGMDAPEIIGFTSTGQKFSTKDLLGKIVYIDVWATWCRPCLEQKKYLADIQQTFSNMENIEFLFVSIDDDVDKWKNHLQSDSKKGLHIISNDGQINIDYKIHGIPRYIIIDHKGKIVSAHAPIPSSVEKVNFMLNELLEQIK